MYDALVVGGHVAGAFTAMLLARRGHRVAVVDKAVFPSDTQCAHHLDPAGVAALRAEGLVEAVMATGCPSSDRMVFTVGTETLELAGPTCSPRRGRLDAVLLGAAGEAGADVRERFTVTDVIWDGDRVVGVVGHDPVGRSVVEYARIVVGADGRHSGVADAVGACPYLVRPPTSCCYYAYWAGLGAVLPERHFIEGRAMAVLPTHDGLACVVANRPVSDWARFKRSPEAMFLAQVREFPSLTARLGAARREARFFGTAETSGCFRRCWGPGWALVGDAGHHRDALVGGGITDALLQAQLLAAALHDSLSGVTSLDDALAAYQRLRDELWRPLYDATCAIASFGWTLQQLPSLLGTLLAAAARAAPAPHSQTIGTRGSGS